MKLDCLQSGRIACHLQNRQPKRLPYNYLLGFLVFRFVFVYPSKSA